MPTGLWVVFEGPDGGGKTTTVRAVAELLTKKLPDIEILTTRHPGSTPLGQHIRTIVKDPEKHGFELDALSTQMLMFTDHINFKHTMLLPALERGAIVLADRCDLISGLVYGAATGLDTTQLNSLMTLACGPKVDLLYVLWCTPEVQEERLLKRDVTDRFEAQALRQQVNQVYAHLYTGPAERTILVNRIVALDNVKYIDSNWPVDIIAGTIAGLISKRYLESLADDTIDSDS